MFFVFLDLLSGSKLEILLFFKAFTVDQTVSKQKPRNQLWYSYFNEAIILTRLTIQHEGISSGSQWTLIIKGRLFTYKYGRSWHFVLICWTRVSMKEQGCPHSMLDRAYWTQQALWQQKKKEKNLNGNFFNEEYIYKVWINLRHLNLDDFGLILDNFLLK